MLNQKLMKEAWLMRRRRVVLPGRTVVVYRAPGVQGGGGGEMTGRSGGEEALKVEEGMVQFVVWCPLMRKLSGRGSTPGSVGVQAEVEVR